MIVVVAVVAVLTFVIFQGVPVRRRADMHKAAMSIARSSPDNENREWRMVRRDPSLAEKYVHSGNLEELTQSPLTNLHPQRPDPRLINLYTHVRCNRGQGYVQQIR